MALAKHVSVSNTHQAVFFPRSQHVEEISAVNASTEADETKVDPDLIIKTLHEHPAEAHKRHVHTRHAVSTITPYSSRYSTQQEISKFKIPRQGAPADAVHQMLKDELDLDGRPNLNLAR